MPLRFWPLVDRREKVAKGLNIFPLAKDPGLLFVHEPFPDPSLNIAPFVLPVSSTNQTSSSFSPFVPPSSYPPFLLRSLFLLHSFIPAHHLYSRFNFSRHFFPSREQEKPGRESGEESSRAMLSV